MSLQSRAGLMLGFLSIVGVGLCPGQSVPFGVSGNTFGIVNPLSGTPSDLLLDEGRGLLYLVNSNANRVDVYDYVNRKQNGPIAVGTFPLSAAISPDGKYMYVSNTQSTTLSVVDLD